MKGEKFLEMFGNIDDKFLKEAEDYTMKKRFNFKPIIAVAACAALALAAVPAVNHFVNTPAVGTQGTETGKIGENAVYTAYELEYHAGDNVLNAEHKTEFVISTGGTTITDKSKLGTKKTIEINGKKFTGIYDYTVKSDYYADDNEVYRCGNGTFSVNTKTGICTSFVPFTEGEIEKIEKYTESECLNIAYKYLSNFIEDPEAYEVKYVYERDWENGYYFMMYRTIDGIATSDRVSIGVRKNGEIFMHIFHSLGAMKNADLSEIDKEAIDKIISDKVDKIYCNSYDLNYNVKHFELVKLADGSYVFNCEVNVQGRNEVGSDIVTDECFIGITMN